MAVNISNTVFPGPFNPKTDKWRDYKEQLLCGLDAAGYTDINNDKVRSLFLAQCGKETYTLLTSLLVPLRPTKVKFAEIIRILDQFYEPEINEILQAGKFHQRVQQKSESVQDYVAAICTLASGCNFTDLKRQLRDKLVLGIHDVRLKRDLLKTKPLTYESALQMCLNFQASFNDMYPDICESKQTLPMMSEPMEIGGIKVKGCRHCTKVHKNGERCPFMNARCFYCKKSGHIANACLKKSQKMYQIQETTSRTSENALEVVEDMMGIYECSTVDSLNQSRITVDILINGVPLTMEVDSGASRSIISEETYKQLWATPPQLCSSNVKLMTVTGQEITVLGMVKVNVVLGNKEALCDLMIVRGKTPNLLGRNWFKQLGLYVAGLCWTNDEISVVMQEFPELFKQDLGVYKGPEVSLHVHSDVVPKFMRARPVPFPLKQQVNDELHRMIKEGVLTPVRYSKWATPLRIVKKDDGSLRICGDYRATVNTAIYVDTYPLPTAMEAFVKLSGGRVFSKLDLKQAYTQLKVDENTAELLTLNTPLGLMKMNRLAFGVNAAPAIFQRIMSSLLIDLEGVACLLDDVAVSGRNIQEHNQRLRKVLSILQDLGFRLNIKKCIFASDSITFLGHMIDSDGLHPSPMKVKEIMEKPAPTNKETLRAFLGLYNFYEKFLPHKSTILEPLYRLLESRRKWVWSEQEEAAFMKAKELLSSEHTLVGYDLKREIVMISDSSEYGLGAIIAHVMDDGSERPIMMASRTLQPHERRYGQIDKEALSIMFGLTKFHEFLAGRQFTIITDHKPLVGLFNPKKPIPDQISPRMLRWSLKLSCYNYTILYRPGKCIGNADALSRWSFPNLSAVIEKPLREILLLEEQPEGWNLDAGHIAMETKKDRTLSKVMFYVLHGWPDTPPDTSLQQFWTRREALSLNKDCLLWCNRVIIPKSLQREVLKLLHAPHAGVVQTKAYARGYVWWLEMDRDIELVVSECEQCQLVRNNPPTEPQHWLPPEKPWSRVHIDFAGPFEGKTFLLLIDSHSKWIEAEIVTSMSSTMVVTILRKIFSSQGLPDVIVSDNGKAFSSEEFNWFLKRNGIRHLYSPPYHPATNGQIERAIQTFKNKLRKISNATISWSKKLSKALYYLRTVPNSITMKTPAEMLNGRKFRTAVSILHPSNIRGQKEIQAEEAAQKTPTRIFRCNQPVLMRTYGFGRKWQRAIVVVGEGPSTYRVRTEDGHCYRRHADQLLPRAQVDRENQQRPIERPAWDQPDNLVHSEPLTSSPPSDIEIPDPQAWPDIIGIPNT